MLIAMLDPKKESKESTVLILIPCIIEYVGINQLNALNYILLCFCCTMAPTFIV
jgi:hypothetical protein